MNQQSIQQAINELSTNVTIHEAYLARLGISTVFKAGAVKSPKQLGRFECQDLVNSAFGPQTSRADMLKEELARIVFTWKFAAHGHSRNVHQWMQELFNLQNRIEAFYDKCGFDYEPALTDTRLVDFDISLLTSAEGLNKNSHGFKDSLDLFYIVVAERMIGYYYAETQRQLAIKIEEHSALVDDLNAAVVFHKAATDHVNIQFTTLLENLTAGHLEGKSHLESEFLADMRRNVKQFIRPLPLSGS